jgi:hypothetical protein
MVRQPNRVFEVNARDVEKHVVLMVELFLRGVRSRDSGLDIFYLSIYVNFRGVGIVAVLCEHQGVRADGCCTAKAAAHNLTLIVAINHPDEVIGRVLKRFEFGFDFLAREGR